MRAAQVSLPDTLQKDDMVTWVTWLSGWPNGIAQAEFGLTCFSQGALGRSPMPFDHSARSILSKGDTVKRHDRVNWLDDTVNWGRQLARRRAAAMVPR